VADQLCSKYGFVKFRFAGALKEAVALIFGWSREDLDDQEFKATEDPFWGMTPRTALQLVGTEAMRNNIRKDIWVKALERRVSDHWMYQSPEKLVRIVIPDVRFPNEVEAVKGWGGKVVHIQRPSNDWTPGGTMNASHPSEAALYDYDDWDDTILNDGTLADLEAKVDVMVDRLGIQDQGC
jgi:hypothetical protein